MKKGIINLTKQFYGLTLKKKQKKVSSIAMALEPVRTEVYGQTGKCSPKCGK